MAMSEGHWVKGIADEITERGDEKIVVHTGKTPSGPIHIGAEREQFICSAIQKELTRRGLESTFNFIIDSYDPIKSIPVGVKVPIGFEENIGKPLSDVPDPLGRHESYAVHYADEFVQCQSRLGLSPNVIYSHVLYQQKEMKDAIRTVLARLDELRIIRKRFIQEEGENSADDWNPVMVVCDNCGKIASKKKEVAPNRVTSWDLRKDEVSYLCTSCGYQGTGSISGTRLKLSWRVDWAAKWAVFKVTCEPAGKDHCVKDGAYDMGLEVCSKIFGYRGPLRVSYEWLTLGDRAMKTHKGITFTPTEWLRIAPPEPLRYLILSADLMRHVSFLPERIPDLVDNFDRLERIYYGSEPPSGNESIKYMRDLYEICTVTNHSSQPGRIPYRFCVYMVQLEGLFTSGGIISKSADYLSKLIGRPATEEEREDMRARLTNAKNWVESYAPPNLKFQISTEAPSYKPKSDEERAFIGAVIKLLEKDLKEDDLQNEIFNVARSLGLEIGEAFSLIYRILLGSERGPRLAPLLMALDRDWLLDRLRSVI
jgi:lysyl-tRNA synthetase class 1